MAAPLYEVGDLLHYGYHPSIIGIVVKIRLLTDGGYYELVWFGKNSKDRIKLWNFQAAHCYLKRVNKDGKTY